MATSLQNIISELKTVALANGYSTVEELKINMKQNSDTELPRLIIKLKDLDYNEFLYNSANEAYNFELTTIIADSDNPISDLKTLMDNLIYKLVTTSNLFAMLSRAGKIELTEADLTNERDVYSRLGGESVTLRMTINNVNNFGVTACQ